MFKLSQVLLNSTRGVIRIPCTVSYKKFSSSPTVAEAKSSLELENNDLSLKTNRSARGQSGMVAAVFASLQMEHPNDEIKTPFTDEKISKAQNIDQLLSISEGTGVSRRHALKVVSVLADWSSTGKVKLSEFETDPRFLKLCRVLTKGASIKNNKNALASRSEDLSTILGVTADDEAAKLVASITLPQMVKVMTTLSQKKRRSTLLLRSLSYNITASEEKLDLKQNADLLYSMAVLNYPDENLLAKIASDVCTKLNSSLKKSAAIGSILTSMGLLKYKNPELLDTLSDWIVKNQSICRPQDIFSLFLSLAALNYLPNNSETLFKELIPQLNISEAMKPNTWLEIVWSLVLLGQANEGHVSSVLNENFIESLEKDNKALATSAKLKLINIDAAAERLMDNYKGTRLPENSNIRKIKITRTKEKTEMVEALVDTLKNLIRSPTHLHCYVNSGAGFYIDAECLLDAKCNPLPLEDNSENASRIALLAMDYHDMTKGKIGLTGLNSFAVRILEKKGYKVLNIPFTEFKASDKLVSRVKYIEQKLKELVKS